MTFDRIYTTFTFLIVQCSITAPARGTIRRVTVNEEQL